MKIFILGKIKLNIDIIIYIFIISLTSIWNNLVYFKDFLNNLK